MTLLKQCADKHGASQNDRLLQVSSLPFGALPVQCHVFLPPLLLSSSSSAIGRPISTRRYFHFLLFDALRLLKLGLPQAS